MLYLTKALSNLAFTLKITRVLNKPLMGLCHFYESMKLIIKLLLVYIENTQRETTGSPNA